MKPYRAMGLICALVCLFLFVEMMAHGRLGQSPHILVRPDRDGIVRVDVQDLKNLKVHFFRFLNAGNQEIKFLVGRDEYGAIQVGFDAGENHIKTKRGFSYQDGWIINNKCETTTRLSELHKGGNGCKPTPLKHRLVGSELQITEADMLKGWRYFR